MLLVTGNSPTKNSPAPEGEGPVLTRKGRGVLLSPLDIQIYITEIPRVKRRHRKAAVLYQMRSLYPADPAGAEIDFRVCPGGNNKAPTLGVLVFAAPGETGRSYRDLGKPLIPGTALMFRALGEARTESAVVVILTRRWIEIGGFRNKTLQWRRAVSRPSGPGPIPLGELPFHELPSIDSIDQSADPAGTIDQAREPGETPPLIIIRETPAEVLPEEWEKVLGGKFAAPRNFNLGDLAKKLNLKKEALYRPGAKPIPPHHRFFILLLILLNLGSLFFSLEKLSAQNGRVLAGLENALAEQRAAGEEAETLRREIAAYSAPGASRRGQGIYGIVAALRESLGEARIRSLLIQENTFTLEAEGPDALMVLRALGESADFEEPSLRQALPSPNGGELFTLSGRIW